MFQVPMIVQIQHCHVYFFQRNEKLTSGLSQAHDCLIGISCRAKRNSWWYGEKGARKGTYEPLGGSKGDSVATEFGSHINASGHFFGDQPHVCVSNEQERTVEHRIRQKTVRKLARELQVAP